MSTHLDLFDSTYTHFAENVPATIRAETFDRDIGQTSWQTVEEFEALLSRLALKPADRVLEIACGTGGPAVYLARAYGCRVTGIDISDLALAAALQAAANAPDVQASFQLADANRPLPFAEASFDALVCIDSIYHLSDRGALLNEWQRVLKPSGRLLFTDSVVITGPISNEELAIRGSVGFFLFMPPGANERLVEQSGLRLLRCDDVTESAVAVSGRWHVARQRYRQELLAIEGEERYAGLQRFFSTSHRLMKEKRLSRFAYIAEKPAV